MSSEEERQTKALEGIERYMKDLVRVFTAVNQNLVEMAKIVEGPSPAWAKSEDRPTTLGEAFRTPYKKEDEQDSEEVLTADGWMKKLHRWWNYTAVGNFDELKITQVEFFNYMNMHGTEMTNQIPPEKR